jgi:FAD synthetase
MMQELRGPTAAIIVIGDEVLSGKVEEQNAHFLVRELRELGVALRRIEIIPDVEHEIATAVRAASATHDLVFTSGGIGPTHDDVTIAAVARAFGVGVVRDPALESLIMEMSGDRFHERDLRMADVPEGAQLLHGDGAHKSRWPVLAMRNVYVLPGIPATLQRKFGMVRERFRSAPFISRRIYSQAREGAIADTLDRVSAAYPDIAVGSYPHPDASDHQVMVTLDGRDAASLESACAEIVAGLGPAVVRVE